MYVTWITQIDSRTENFDFGVPDLYQLCLKSDANQWIFPPSLQSTRLVHATRIYETKESQEKTSLERKNVDNRFSDVLFFWKAEAPDTSRAHQNGLPSLELTLMGTMNSLLQRAFHKQPSGSPRTHALRVRRSHEALMTARGDGREHSRQLSILPLGSKKTPQFRRHNRPDSSRPFHFDPSLYPIILLFFHASFRRSLSLFNLISFNFFPSLSVSSFASLPPTPPLRIRVTSDWIRKHIHAPMEITRKKGK